MSGYMSHVISLEAQIRKVEVVLEQMTTKAAPFLVPAVLAVIRAVPDSAHFPEVLAGMVATLPDQHLTVFTDTLQKMLAALVHASNPSTSNDVD